ncbi:unnamed protein product [Penicillium glandicola]
MEKDSTEVKAMQDEKSLHDIELANFSALDEQKVIRKIDRVILPLMCTQAIGYAAVFNLAADLDLSSDEYSWVVSIFYLGQLVSEYFFIYLMSRLPIAKFVGVMIVLWGIVAGCLAAPHDFAGFASVRFILGAFEGAVSPAFVLITSRWYKKSEHPIRIAAWVSCNGLASIVGALIMYGVGQADGVSIANWRLMFLVCGGATIVCGIFFFWLMPGGPESAWFLTEDERKIATARLHSDGSTKEGTGFKKSQLFEALKDPFCWFAVLFGFFGTFASPVLKFASLVISGFGWSPFNTMLVGLPSGALQIIFIWTTVLGMRATKIPRCYWGLALTVLPLIGNIGIFLIPSTNKWGLVIFTWLAAVISPVMVVTLSLLASNIKGSTKKSAVSNTYFILYGAAAVAAPQLWQTADAPRYRKGLIADVVCFGVIILLFLAYRFLALWENKRRDEAQASGETGSAPDGEVDITDRQDKSFRYIS